MVKRDNDKTKNTATPFVIIAAVRTGGTFLSHCLSNHTQVYCDRAESLHHLSVWCTTVKGDRRRILAALLNQTGYHASGCKLTYTQAFNDDIWKWLVKKQPKVIWLYRENVLRQAISVHLNRLVRDGAKIKRPAHTFDETGPVSIEISPALFLKYAEGLTKQNKWASERVKNFNDVYQLTYDDLVGEGSAAAEKINTTTAKKICDFLGVRYEPLKCDLKRVNHYPLSQLIKNWPDVEAAIKSSEFAGMLAEANQ